MDLTEAEDIKKRWHDPDNHNGVITHLEPDILECGCLLSATSPDLRHVVAPLGGPPDLGCGVAPLGHGWCDHSPRD